MVVFTGKRFNLSKGEIPGTLYGTSESGGWTRICFMSGFPTISSSMLYLADLFFDGHSSHYILDLVKEAAEKQVDILNSTINLTNNNLPVSHFSKYLM